MKFQTCWGCEYHGVTQFVSVKFVLIDGHLELLELIFLGYGALLSLEISIFVFESLHSTVVHSLLMHKQCLGIIDIAKKKDCRGQF